MYPEEVILHERSLQRLSSLYQNAYRQIEREMATATNFGVANRRALLVQIKARLVELGVDVKEVIGTELPDQYKQGADDAVKQLKHVGAEVNVAEGFNVIHHEAINALVDETATAFAESLQGVSRSTRTLLSQAVKQKITEQLATGKLGGKALREIKNTLIGTLRQEGLSALIDRRGRKWELDRYTEMLIRTKSVEARNRGLVNRMVENGYDLVQVSSHGATDACGTWEGRILSMRGESKGYPTVDQARQDGLFHPNCRHAINVLVPELARVTKAYDSGVPTLGLDEVEEKLKRTL